MTVLQDLDQTEDLLLLREIFSADGAVWAYSLHEKYRLSPGQIFSAATKLQSLGLASFIEAEADFQIRLSGIGAVFCVANADAIWTERNAYWKQQFPERFGTEPAEKFIYYCPPEFAKRTGQKEFGYRPGEV